MKQLLLHGVLSLAFFNVFINADVVLNRSNKDFQWRNTQAPASPAKTDNPKASQSSVRAKKLSRRERCCILGREVAKIGETCTYAANADRTNPDSHFHQMKTSVWMTQDHPIKRRLLQKCKPYKVFYEKCCHYEYSQISEDLKKARRKIKLYLRKIKENEVTEGEGSSDIAQEGLQQESGNSQNKQKYNP